MGKWWKGFSLAVLVWSQGALAGTVLVVGDSISAAFGLETSQGWVALLQEHLRGQPGEHRVVNASISGDTSAGGLARLPRLLDEHSPEVVILELGGNDGLRGQPPEQLKRNLAAMVDKSQQAGAQVLLLGMRLPPNLGVRYTGAFAEAFDSLARERKLAYVPFLLEGVGGVSGMMQRDGIHPTADAQPLLLDNVLPALAPLL
ncbi:arylesterase [Stutzerimonas kirkiae]|uniref:Arylesterase n=1 Tax=Stutzerimonas kirkiae TaxID=2211392 RepID=A0A4Q9QZH5_9GAMM|nr:arylesterase [Stutzerimonas kirkiae]TBU91300.1 arylesterase [Stutzerimonas kirkiae]TBV00430.1 arylesterase [Stutzerimonas kirkiae]TBV11796.1 arylesterase [Stutzerimonas kirkiae]TBV15278.1 arylesterase [Stutzerimonas kirkiae]